VHDPIPQIPQARRNRSLRTSYGSRSRGA
jgi:hypothetical protein